MANPKRKLPPPAHKPAGHKKRLAVDMQQYHKYVNWMKWWEEFFSSIRPNGLPLYSRVYDFARIKAESRPQLDFLMWYLGPTKEPDPDAEKYPFVLGGPLDWMEKRESGGWFTDRNLRLLSHKITEQRNALEALREAGNGIVIHAMSRVERLMQQLDKEFSGRFFLPDLDIHTNYARARAYIGMHAKLISMLAKTQEIYARSHGINYDDMSSFAQLVAASTAMVDKAEGRVKSRLENAIGQLNELALVKAAKYGLQLPEDMENKVIDISPAREKKKSVN